MTTPERYIELIELAQCSPDSPHLAAPASEGFDHIDQARWLAVRLAKRGHRVTVAECAEAADAFFIRSVETTKLKVQDDAHQGLVDDITFCAQPEDEGGAS